MVVRFIHCLGIGSKCRKSVVHGFVVVALKSCLRVKGFKGMAEGCVKYQSSLMSGGSSGCAEQDALVPAGCRGAKFGSSHMIRKP
jgi:hypothetical protein